jgi:arsenite methyltransferase
MAIVEKIVKERYGQGAQQKEDALCCPVNYDPKYLKIIPEEIIEKDYGCGDPSTHLKEGETVLDLGSGAGKICYIASQVVGPKGKVIGVDMTNDMLELAEKYHGEMAEKLGYDNVIFKKGYIEDLKIDLKKIEEYLYKNPVQTLADFERLNQYKEELSKTSPLITDNSIDVVVSNCVLNLVSPEKKRELFKEMYRVLKKGGRCVISDIVSDEPSPQHLMDDPELWSGCISGAFEEHDFLKAFEDAGFYGIEILTLQEESWQVIEGIEYRSMTVVAYKGKEGECLDRNQAVIYKGPWKAVVDDDGHTLFRGERMAVCDKTFQIYKSETYGKDIISIEPTENIALKDADAFNCRKNARRPATETKGKDYKATKLADSPYCDPNSGCC